jgi:hypothetical protein
VGRDAHQHLKGRKRHLVVDTLGLVLGVGVTAAALQDAPRADVRGPRMYGTVPRFTTRGLDAG